MSCILRFNWRTDLGLRRQKGLPYGFDTFLGDYANHPKLSLQQTGFVGFSARPGPAPEATRETFHESQSARCSLLHRTSVIEWMMQYTLCVEAEGDPADRRSMICVWSMNIPPGFRAFVPYDPSFDNLGMYLSLSDACDRCNDMLHIAR